MFFGTVFPKKSAQKEPDGMHLQFVFFYTTRIVRADSLYPVGSVRTKSSGNLFRILIRIAQSAKGGRETSLFLNIVAFSEEISLRRTFLHVLPRRCSEFYGHGRWSEASKTPLGSASGIRAANTSLPSRTCVRRRKRRKGKHGIPSHISRTGVK